MAGCPMCGPPSACSRPVLLRGSVRYADPATGEVTGTIRTDDLPDKVIYKPCGNRRATACPGCAEVYRRDAFHLIRAGLAGGKGIPESVAANPVVFATFTAPSFGPVHSRPVRLHSCAGKQHCRCKAEPCHPRRDAGTCPHGRPLACYRRHAPGDPRLGEPLCMDCYDYPAHVVWNAAAGELWRRTKQDIERHLIQLAARRGIPWPTEDLPPRPRAARQGRRIPGPRRRPLPRPAPSRRHQPQRPRRDHHAPARHHRRRRPGRHPPGRRHRLLPHPSPPRQPDGEGWLIAWGRELDVRTVADRGPGAVTGLAVASYLAKYATKGTEASGHASARITPDSLDLHADPAGTHTQRLIDACWHIGHASGRMCGKVTYASLRRWAHMLGFGGHFLTKARRYSVTLTALRQARITYRRHQRHRTRLHAFRAARRS